MDDEIEENNVLFLRNKINILEEKLRFYDRELEIKVKNSILIKNRNNLMKNGWRELHKLASY